MLARAVATGRSHLLVATQATSVITDSRGRVTGVAMTSERQGKVWRRTVAAPMVVVAAGVTNGGVNPVLTIFANTYRVIERLLAVHG